MLSRSFIAMGISISLITQTYTQTLWAAPPPVSYLKIYLDQTGLNQSNQSYDHILARLKEDLHPEDYAYFKKWSPQLSNIKISKIKPSMYTSQQGHEQVTLDIEGKNFIVSVDGRGDISQVLPTVKVVGGSKGQNLKLTIQPENMSQEALEKAVGLNTMVPVKALFVMLSRKQFLNLSTPSQKEYVKRLADVMTAAEAVSNQLRRPASTPPAKKAPVGRKGAFRYHWSQGVSWGDLVLDNLSNCLQNNNYLQTNRADCDLSIEVAYRNSNQPCVIGGWPGKVIESSCVPNPEEVSPDKIRNLNETRVVIGQALTPNSIPCNPLIYGSQTAGSPNDRVGFLVTDAKSGCRFPGGEMGSGDNNENGPGDAEARLSEIFRQYRETHSAAGIKFEDVKLLLERQINRLKDHCDGKDNSVTDQSSNSSSVRKNQFITGVLPTANQSVSSPWWLSSAWGSGKKQSTVTVRCSKLTCASNPAPAAHTNASSSPLIPLSKVSIDSSAVANVTLSECKDLDTMIARLRSFQCTDISLDKTTEDKQVTIDLNATKQLKKDLQCSEPAVAASLSEKPYSALPIQGQFKSTILPLLMAGFFGAILGGLLRGRKTRYITKTETKTVTVEKLVPGETIYIKQPPVYIDRAIPVRVEVPVPGPAQPPTTIRIPYTPPVRQGTK